MLFDRQEFWGCANSGQTLFSKRNEYNTISNKSKAGTLQQPGETGVCFLLLRFTFEQKSFTCCKRLRYMGSFISRQRTRRLPTSDALVGYQHLMH